MSDLVVVANRSPVAFRLDARGELETAPGGGGLVSSLGPLLEGTGARWIAAAMNDAERVAAGRGVIEVNGISVRTLDIDATTYRQAYDVIANGTLWFLYHGLFDLPRRPLIDRRWREAWDGYRLYNDAFVAAVAHEAPEGATVLVQDYHLSLMGQPLAEKRPDLAVVHFSHTPFCGPNSIRVLPDAIATELLEGMAAFTACGFHTERWVRAFEACCREVGVTPPPTFVAPIAPDTSDLAALAVSPDATEDRAWLDGVVGERKMILRVDRIELSKNLLRGFLAYDDLLRTQPSWRGQVVFVALVYPSREGLAEYLGYRSEVEALVARINAEWATPGWTPIVLDTGDNLARSAVALTRYDVLLVNPVKDGLNLVALEGPAVNANDGMVLLSRDAGVFDHIGDVAVALNPYDIAATSEAMHDVLSMGGTERAARAAALRERAGARQPQDWLDDQLAGARLRQ